VCWGGRPPPRPPPPPPPPPPRLAFVGHSYNAHTGGILSAVEKRIGTFVLMAGAFADEEYIFDSTRKEMVEYRQREGEEALRDFFHQYPFDDPIYFIGHSAPASVFLQFGKDDEGIPESFARGYFDRFEDPKKISFYKAGHALNGEARKDRVLWLAERLKLKPIETDAIERVPPVAEGNKEEKKE
jgi:hypothetical protein